MERKVRALLAAAVFCLGTLAGCAQKPQEAEPAPETRLRNDGRSVRLVLGGLCLEDGRGAVLEEIVEKYRADFPGTAVEVRSYPDEEALGEALRAGELDLAEMSDRSQLAYVKEGLLEDIYPYLLAWRESATLTMAAQQAVGSMGREQAYLLPNGFTQDLIYYRADWFEECGLMLETGVGRVRTWDEIAGGMVAGEMTTGTSEKMGDRGKLAFAGKEKLVDCFDAMLWGSIGMGRAADTSAAYFSAADEKSTVFTMEKAQEGADQFLRVMTGSALPEALDWTEEEALEAFLDGRAGMLLADRSVMPKIRESLPEGSWKAAGPPRGRVGKAVVPDHFTGWGIAASAAEKEIAAHFLTFLSNADNNTHYAKVCGAVPIHLEAARLEPAFEETDLAVEVEMTQRSDWYQYASQPVRYEAHKGYREQADEKLRLFAAGEIGREELMAFLDSYWSEARETEGKLWVK